MDKTLDLLAQAAGRNQELAEKLDRLGIDKVTLYRNVESLEALGLLKKMDPIVSGELKNLNLSDKEAETLSNLLDKLRGWILAVASV